MAARKKKEKGKLSGLNANGKPNAYWRRFKERLDAYEEVEIKDWKDEHLLAHILRRYKNMMGVEFTLSYSGAPTKCKEMYCVRRMVHFLSDEENRVFQKEYIDWIFDDVIIPTKAVIHSIAYFYTTELILKFKKDRRKKNTVTRATSLPEDYGKIVSEMELDIDTYGDLAFANIALEQSPDDEDLKEYVELFSRLKGVGFDISVLSSFG